MLTIGKVRRKIRRQRKLYSMIEPEYLIARAEP